VRFLVDAHLPRRLAHRLAAAGHEAIHTLDLPAGNRTSDEDICVHADVSDAVVITKDADFVVARALRGSPKRLLVVSTGNIGNTELIHLIGTNLVLIEEALLMPAHVELGRDSLIVHE
jgi:predicted nuclease of predicted toxin-antitoxin system